jgi:23S rRNA (uracil1939-C5)-methyltransferase
MRRKAEDAVLKKNQIIELKIEDISHQAAGVGRSGGMAVFVPESVVGDILRVRIVKVLGSHCYGIIEEIAAPSPYRIEPSCTVFGRCGGCAFRHVDYSAELKIKNGWVRENLKRIGGVSPCMAEPMGDGRERCRNKAVFPVREVAGRAVVGFFARRSHRIVEPDDCLLHPAEFSELRRALSCWMDENNISAYDEKRHSGHIRALFIRKAEATGQVMACVVSTSENIPEQNRLITAFRSACPSISSIMLNINTEKTNVLLGAKCATLWGSSTITDILCGISVSISPLSFHQVNQKMAQLLYCVVRDYAGLSRDELVVDLYCGTGIIGLYLAQYAREVVGIEAVESAVLDAKHNAAINNIQNIRFICADAKDGANQLLSQGIKPDVVVLDPPRKGCDADVIAAVAAMSPKRIVMVSCDSATAARDVALFKNLGYNADRAQTVDMFPRTAHVETVVLMSRKG